jgi:hypothetical protein
VESFPTINLEKRRCYNLKLKKKSAMIISLTVGTLMFATTALAEVAAKSGYEQTKDAMKYTADSLTSKVSSYTMDMSLVLKDNGTVINSEESVNKYDVKKNSCFNVTTRVNGSEKTESVYYRDNEGYISYNDNDGIYRVIEQSNNEQWLTQKNPFKEKQAGDLEKIADALVGNLKDAVVVSQNPNGSKELSGTLSEAQIPSLVSAVVSFQFKSRFGSYVNNPNDRSNMPKITQDIFVKEVKGKMVVDKNGLIQSVLGTGVLYGKDEQGKEHNLTFELLGKMSNVNSTVVNKPDLTGKKVEKSIVQNYKENLSNPEMYLGTYKSNIIIIKDNKFQKIGERFVEIQKIDNKIISGRYYEQFAKGYEDYAASAKEFKFNAQSTNYPYDAAFEYSNESGKTVRGNININPMMAKVYVNFDNNQSGSLIYDGEFERVFN